jgi:circadian clock protein KaiB
MPLGKTKVSKKKSKDADRRPPKKNRLVFRLYVAGGERASARALANLRAICREHFDANYEIEVVDALKNPRRAKRNGIIAIPTLVKRSPAPAWVIVGDLSEDALILDAMKTKRRARRTT